MLKVGSRVQVTDNVGATMNNNRCLRLWRDDMVYTNGQELTHEKIECCGAVTRPIATRVAEGWFWSWRVREKDNTGRGRRPIISPLRDLRTLHSTGLWQRLEMRIDCV